MLLIYNKYSIHNNKGCGNVKKLKIPLFYRKKQKKILLKPEE